MFSISKTSGVYILLNSKSKKIYIGQTNNLRKRWMEHRAMLRGNYHANSKLQRAWNKYGENSFKFQVLEYCSVEQLDEREQHYLDIYIPRGVCYNLSKDAILNTRGQKLSPEHRKKLSEKQSNRTDTHKQRLNIARHNRAPVSDITRQRMSDSRIGRRLSDETKKKIGLKHHKITYLIISPSGNAYTTNDLTTFSKEHDLSSHGLTRVSRGDRTHHKGWKCQKIEVLP
jgi:group I intron endonuclease